MIKGKTESGPVTSVSELVDYSFKKPMSRKYLSFGFSLNSFPKDAATGTARLVSAQSVMHGEPVPGRRCCRPWCAQLRQKAQVFTLVNRLKSASAPLRFRQFAVLMAYCYLVS